MIFKEERLQKELLREGIVKIPLLNQKQVNYLQAFIENETQMPSLTKEYGFIGGVCINDKKEKKTINNEIEKIVLPLLNNVIADFKALVYSVLGKGIGSSSELEIHQDWSVVDESKHDSYSLWVPLIDCTLKNGAIHAVKGSHLEFNNYRGGSIPSLFEDKKLAKKYLDKMTLVEVKAGEALIFNQRLVHFSPPNKSDQIRYSIISSLVPKEADVLLYYKNNDNNISAYKMNDNFFNEYDNFLNEKNKKPNGYWVKDITF